MRLKSGRYGWILLVGMTGFMAATAVSAEQIASRHIYVVDGDTVKAHGVKYRLVGFDTPETYQPKCDYEKARGHEATMRVRTLIAEAKIVDLVVLPGRDKYGRGLARLFVRGQDVGQFLISEGMARAYDGGKRASWCD